jgi:hypothetical protein
MLKAAPTPLDFSKAQIASLSGNPHGDVQTGTPDGVSDRQQLLREVVSLR